MPRPDPPAPPASEHPPPVLGAFLRARRDMLRPEDFGLASGSRRRAPGLRREEVAALCGISPTWYAWIEQGRTRAISVQTLGAMARGLKLSQAERSYLFGLASRADPAHPLQTQSDPHQLTSLVGAIVTPAYVIDRHWDAIAWNQPAAELFEDWLGAGDAAGGEISGVADGGDRNLLRYVFLHPRARGFIDDWSGRARRLVAEYRADTAAWHDDPVRRALVDELSWASPEFATAWRLQQVLSREGGLRTFQHPQKGRCAYEQFTLRVALQSELKLTVLVQ